MRFAYCALRLATTHRALPAFPYTRHSRASGNPVNNLFITSAVAVRTARPAEIAAQCASRLRPTFGSTSLPRPLKGSGAIRCAIAPYVSYLRPTASSLQPPAKRAITRRRALSARSSSHRRSRPSALRSLRPTCEFPSSIYAVLRFLGAGPLREAEGQRSALKAAVKPIKETPMDTGCCDPE